MFIYVQLRELDNSKTKLFQSDTKGKALIEGLFEQLFEEAEDLKASTNSVSESLAPIVERLKQIKLQLERLALTHKWTLRETDLYTYHVSLTTVTNKWVSNYIHMYILVATSRGRKIETRW
jgi:hypothetical protein